MAKGLLYLRARWYDPATGRFLTRDPFPGLPVQPTTLHPYTYALNNPVLYVDPSGEYIESLLDILFIAYDIGSIASDIYQLQQAGGCEKQDLYRQLGIDVGALLLDVAFLALPGVTGGGPGLRLALAGGGHLTVAGAVRAGRIMQWGYKGVQVGGQVLRFAKRGGSSRGDRGKTGGTSHTTVKKRLGKQDVRVDVEFPTGGSSGNVHVHVGSQKYYLNSPEDLALLPKSIRKNRSIQQGVEKAFDLLSRY